MCTAVTYKTGDHYFGRNLDLEYYTTRRSRSLREAMRLIFEKRENRTAIMR